MARVEEAEGIRHTILALADHYERDRRGYVQLKILDDEKEWLPRLMAQLRSQKHIEEHYQNAIVRFSDIGYSHWQPWIDGWRQSKTPVGSGDLSLALLLKIMMRLKELRAGFAAFTMSDLLFDLAPLELRAQGPASTSYYIDAHLEFLSQRGFVELGRPSMMVAVRSVKLTSAGQIFVQPELADFGNASVLPKVLEELQERAQILTYPDQETEGMLYSLREAIAKNAPDMVVKFIVEIAARLASQSH